MARHFDTASKILGPFSLAQNALKVEIEGNSWHSFFNCGRTFDLTNLTSELLHLHFMMEKLRPDVLTLSVVLRSFSLAHSLPKGRNAPIWRIENRDADRGSNLKEHLGYHDLN